MAYFTREEIEHILQEYFDTESKLQYVGARYITLFGRKGEDTMEWDDGAPYEPLTVVLNEGNSYVSRTYVPTGIDISDTRYWLKAFDFNAQVEQYRRETAAATEAAAAAQESANNVNDDIEILLPKSSFSSTNTIKDYIDNVVTNYPIYPNCVLIGDSWTSDTTSTITDGINWQTYLPYWTFHNYAIGGSGFIAGSNNRYSMQAARAAADTSYNHDEVTHCLIVGGINDWRVEHSGEPYISPMMETINALHNAFRNAKIIVIFASTDRPQLATDNKWNDSFELWSQLKRWLLYTYPRRSTPGGPIECYVITNMFPESAFIQWGEQYYERHLSSTGHQQMAVAMQEIVMRSKNPTLTMLQLADTNIPADVSGINLTNLIGSINEFGIHIEGGLNLSSSISSATRAYFDLNEDTAHVAQYFDTNPSTGVYAATPQDFFPKTADDSVASSNRWLQFIGRTGVWQVVPRWGETVTHNATMPCMVVSIGYGYANQPLRLILDIGSGGAGAGIYNFSIDLPFMKHRATHNGIGLGLSDVDAW